ncbi:MAG: selenocysteine-specific translation elongation factor [Planctomycetaceae bacterium]
MTYTIVGVIGHIDHGKTSLVAALTGVDTDTHPEEKRRGITIDLGFASFSAGDHRFALIDAPGHQKYIGNLLAGVASIDVGLLVVACDQGIQAQTLEHASILKTLGVTRLVVALSRIDLASEDIQAGLREELELFLDDFGFTDVPMVPVSSIQKTGLDKLQEQLCCFADTIEARPVGSYFRMPVDRVFSMPGRGCVIAGTVWSGTVSVGDRLQLADSGQEVRVREVEVHGEAVDSSRVGYRTALNVTGVSVSDVQRGDELIQADVFRHSHHLLLEVRTFANCPELRCPATVQLHLAATACAAKITGIRRLQPAQSTVVVVETDAAVVATFGQKCLLRLPYPVGTIGGGSVLAVLGEETKRTRKLIELGERIALADASERLTAWMTFLTEVEPTPAWLELQLGICAGDDQETAKASALQSGSILPLPGTTRLVSAVAVERIQRHLVDLLTRQAECTRDAWLVEESAIQQSRSFGSAELIRWCVQNLVDDGKVVRLGKVIAVASDENALSKKQQARMEKVVAAFDGNRSPPSLKELCDQLQLPLETVTSLTRFGVQTGMLLDTGNGLLLSASVFRDMCTELGELFQQKNELTASEIKDQWQVTRKHAIPFLEYCDRQGVTVRKGDVRIAGT